MDADTADVVIDNAFHTTLTVRVRLLHVNAAELHSPDLQVRADAVNAKQVSEQWSATHAHDPDPWPLILRTEKDDAFGRYLAEIWCSHCIDEESLNAMLLRTGHAVPYVRK